MIRSGWLYGYGIGFWGPNGHDGVWHIALSESLARGSLNNPVFSGEPLKNYHIGFDLLLALVNQIIKVPVNTLYFQIIPPIMAFLIGLLTYKFIFLWRKSKSEAFWSTAFVYFGSGLGFLLTFLRNGEITGESMFWSQQSLSTLVNPPLALSLIFILLGLIFLQKYEQTRKNYHILLSMVFFGLLIQIKAYAAILVLGGLFVSGAYSLVINHKFHIMKVFCGSLLINIILFFMVKNDSVSVFTWYPFWFLETMMIYSDRVGWERFYSAMTTYKMGNIWLKATLAYATAFLIFIVGNMGLRVIGFWYFLQKKLKIDSTLIILVTISGVGLLIPMFFVQVGTPWNTIQFFYYYLFIFSLFAGIVISRSGLVIKALFITFSIFGSWATLQHYLPPKPQSMVTKSELEALSFLKQQSNAVVLTYPYDKYKAIEALKNPPRPLYTYDSTAYVSAYAHKNVYIEDEVNLNIMGYEWKERRDNVFNFFTSLDLEFARSFLEDNNIKYLYLVKEMTPLSGELMKIGPSDLNLTKIYENEIVVIYSR